MENTDITKEVREQAKTAEIMLQTAKSLIIHSQSDYVSAGADLAAIKAKAKELEDTRKGMTQPLDAAKKKIMDFFRAPLGFLADAERILKRSMLDYQQEAERKRREEEARLQEMARKEQERLEKRAQTAEAKGKIEQAEMLRETAETIHVPTVSTPKPAASGIAVREIWKAEVTDLNALLQAVLDGKVPLTVIKVDMQVLNAQARTLKDHLNYPGVKTYAEKTMAARSA